MRKQIPIVSRATLRDISRLLVLAVAGGIPLAAGGCGDTDALESMVVYPVSGRILLKDDKPLSSGQVVFVLPAKGLEFSSPIGADGTFKMTSQFGEGIPDGEYAVRIAPPVSEVAGVRKSGAKVAWTQPYPGIYSDETTSNLKATVKSGANSLEPFRLVDGSAAGKSKSARTGRDHDD